VHRPFEQLPHALKLSPVAREITSRVHKQCVTSARWRYTTTAHLETPPPSHLASQYTSPHKININMIFSQQISEWCIILQSRRGILGGLPVNTLQRTCEGRTALYSMTHAPLASVESTQRLNNDFMVSARIDREIRR
jgi:hypothetical protein